MIQTKLPLTENCQSSCHSQSCREEGPSPCSPQWIRHQQGCEIFNFFLVWDQYLAIWTFFLMDPEVRTGFPLLIWQESTWFYRTTTWPPLSCPSSNNVYYFCLTQYALEPDRSGLNCSSVLSIVLTWANFFVYLNLRFFISKMWINDVQL